MEILITGGKKDAVIVAVRIIRDTRNYSKGIILHCPEPMARRFVKEGFAEYLKTEVTE